MKNQQKLADEAAKAVQAAKTEAGRVKEAISSTSCQIDRLAHDLEIQTKESKEAGQRVSKCVLGHHVLAHPLTILIDFS